MLLAMLRAVVSEQQDDWDDQLHALLGDYRSTPHSSTGVSPYHMPYGVEMTMPLDLVLVMLVGNSQTFTVPRNMWNGYVDQSEMLIP